MSQVDHKPCSNCGVVKSRSDFYKSPQTKSGMASWCIACYKQKAASNRKSSKEEFDLIVEQRKRRADALAAGLIHYQSAIPCKHGHKAKRLVSTHQCVTCLRERKQKDRKSRGAVSLKLSAFKRMVASNNGQKRYFTGAKCKNGHVAERLVSTRQCCACLAERYRSQKVYEVKESDDSKRRRNAKKRSRVGRAKTRIYQRECLSKRAGYKMKHVMYSMIRRIFISKAGSRTKDLLGYDKEKLMQRIEFQFKDGMNWSNYGEWHIDHIKPLSRFFEQGESRPHVINALCNLRPMWARDNMSKSDKFVLR